MFETEICGKQNRAHFLNNIKKTFYRNHFSFSDPDKDMKMFHFKENHCCFICFALEYKTLEFYFAYCPLDKKN